jgi:hypothetical protein
MVNRGFIKGHRDAKPTARLGAICDSRTNRARRRYVSL